ncbi:MAG: PhzF family phenazine biosynthesis protein [Pseudomonadota bacterium]
MSPLPYEIWDVFTETKFAGNPLAVVHGADRLSTDEMQSITREFNLSETSFVLTPEDQSHEARVRIFTPGYEMPYAGHPTVGTSLALAAKRNLSGSFILGLNAGAFEIELEGGEEGEGAARTATFTNPNLPKETGLAPSVEAIETALSLPRGRISDGDHRPRCVGAGVDFVYARASLDDVRAARLNSVGFEALNLDEIVGVLLYAEGGDTPGADYHVRMFAPNAGVPEDPATGSASAALPGQIALAGGVADGNHSWTVEQGFEMGRPSIIKVKIEAAAGQVTKVQVGGSAVKVAEGTLDLS